MSKKCTLANKYQDEKFQNQPLIKYESKSLEHELFLTLYPRGGDPVQTFNWVFEYQPITSEIYVNTAKSLI